MGELKDEPTKCVSSDYAVGEMEHHDKKLLRRVDWQILPIMFLTYFLQFVDKISLNVCDVVIPSHNANRWLVCEYYGAAG